MVIVRPSSITMWWWPRALLASSTMWMWNPCRMISTLPTTRLTLDSTYCKLRVDFALCHRKPPTQRSRASGGVSRPPAPPRSSTPLQKASKILAQQVLLENPHEFDILSPPAPRRDAKHLPKDAQLTPL